MADKGASHDMEAIRDAAARGDVEASKTAHAAGVANKEEHSGAKSEYIKSMVFGGLDGIITTFAVVAAGAGAQLQPRIVILLGCANLISDGISMGLGDFFSERAEKDGEDAQRERVLTIVSKKPKKAGEIVCKHFVDRKGFGAEDAEKLVASYSKYSQKFTDFISGEEGLSDYLERLAANAPDENVAEVIPSGDDDDADDDEEELWKQGLVTMGSFWSFGSIPVIAFAIATALGFSGNAVFIIDIVVTICTLAGLGFAQAAITAASYRQKAMQMIINGALACAAGYIIAGVLAVTLGEGDLCEGATCRPPFIDRYRFSDAPWLSFEEPADAPDGDEATNWDCSSHAWSDVSDDDTEHIVHMRVDLFAGENGYFEAAGVDGHSPVLEMNVGETYFFDQTHHTNWMHPLGFAYFPDGHHGRTWGGDARDEITDFSALEYRINNAKAKRIISTEIMDFNAKAYDSAFMHPKQEWLQKKHGVQLTITDEIAAKAAEQGCVLYYYSRFHSKTSGKIKLVGCSASAEEPADEYTPVVPQPFDETCGTYDTRY
eukprot:COSAG02_NODE_2882_length_7818_cov_12.332642_2_plen_546_part_00